MIESINFKTIQACIDNVIETKNDLCQQIGIKYDSQDARLVALDSLHCLLLSIIFWIRTLNANFDSCVYSSDIKFSFLLKIESGLSFETTFNMMHKTLRLSTATLAFFTIDNLFCNILRDQKLKTTHSFQKNMDELFDFCNFNPEDSNYYKNIFKAFSFIRNSLHNNAIHRNKDLKLQIHDLCYNFQSSKMIVCASWDHILNIIYESISNLRKILLSQNAKKLKHQILDEFASEL